MRRMQLASQNSYKIGREVAVVAVEDQKSPSSSCFRLHMSLEHLFEPDMVILVYQFQNAYPGILVLPKSLY
jgi:hypothetical protein